jgi:hypothetical protein
MLRRWKNEIADHGGHSGYPVGDTWFYRRKNGTIQFSGHGNSWLEVPVPPPACDIDTCHCFLGMGFFRKRKPFDCGNPRCGLCHLDKFGRKDRYNTRRRAIEFELKACE